MCQRGNLNRPTKHMQFASVAGGGGVSGFLHSFQIVLLALKSYQPSSTGPLTTLDVGVVCCSLPSPPMLRSVVCRLYIHRTYVFSSTLSDRLTGQRPNSVAHYACNVPAAQHTVVCCSHWLAWVLPVLCLVSTTCNIQYPTYAEHSLRVVGSMAITVML